MLHNVFPGSLKQARTLKAIFVGKCVGNVILSISAVIALVLIVSSCKIIRFPRCALCYQREHMILVGVICGPHEPALHVNTFLEQLVHDLLKLWNGVEVQTCEGPQIICAALLYNSSDIPATRKVGILIFRTCINTTRVSVKPYIYK